MGSGDLSEGSTRTPPTSGGTMYKRLKDKISRFADRVRAFLFEVLG